MNAQDGDARVEGLLRRWRPAPPSPELRERVLVGARAAWTQRSVDDVPVWTALRPLAQALAASVVLLLTTRGVSGWLNNGHDEGQSACVTTWTPLGFRTVRVFEDKSTATADAGAAQRWRAQVAAELANGRTGGAQ